MKTKILKKVFKICIILFLLTEVAALWRLSLKLDKKTEKPLSGDAVFFEKGWTYGIDGGKKAEFPLLKTEGQQITLTSRLPQVAEGEELILFQQYQSVQVYVDGQCIYTSPSLERRGFQTSVGTVIAFVPLEPEHSGKKVEVHMERLNSSQYMMVGHVYLCSRSDFVLSYINDNAGKIFFAAAMVIGGIFMAVAYMWLGRKRPGYEYRMFLYLGIFAVQMAVWVLTDAQIPQLFTGAHVAGGILSFGMFMLLPVPFISFISAICEKNNRILKAVQIVLVVNFSVQMGLYIGGCFDLMEMLKVTHLVFAAAMAAIVITGVREVRATRSYYVMGILAAILFMAAAGILALAGYNLISGFHYMGVVLTGFFIFFLALTYLCLHKTYRFIEDGTRAKVYQKLAYMDVMTQIENRRAFEEELMRLQKVRPDENLTFVEFDLNTLKETNDRWGHKAGDEIIIETARCIKRAFAGRGKVYRTGGDEFVVIANLTEKRLKACLRIMEQLIGSYNRQGRYQMSVSRGYASVREYREMKFEEILAIADGRMYQNKEEMKNSS